MYLVYKDEEKMARPQLLPNRERKTDSDVWVEAVKGQAVDYFLKHEKPEDWDKPLLVNKLKGFLGKYEYRADGVGESEPFAKLANLEQVADNLAGIVEKIVVPKSVVDDVKKEKAKGKAKAKAKVKVARKHSQDER